MSFRSILSMVDMRQNVVLIVNTFVGKLAFWYLQWPSSITISIPDKEKNYLDTLLCPQIP